MAIIGASVPTLIDVTVRLAPDGRPAAMAELLTQTNEVLEDMTWKEGNLPTGERTSVRTGLPAVYFRALNEGIPRSKSTAAQIDEGAAMLEGFQEVDRKVAILGGDVAGYRADESRAFFESMSQRMALTLFYGNAGASPKEFTGLSPRYNSLSGVSGDNIIDAGGTGTDNHSIWLVYWSTQTITGIYPKATVAGLMHNDVTSNRAQATDGFPIGDTLYDSNGNPYLGYRDHYEWNCGLSVKDWRCAVRIANIDRSLLTKDKSTGADLEDLMIQAVERVRRGGGNGAFYMPTSIRAWMRRQMVNRKSAFLSMEEFGGRRVPAFDGIPLRQVDALNIDEARVV
jgi:hypothetical protein